ncbi:MAG: SdrD B-like domain-containing protein, partial [Bacteroidota bacterium]
FFFANKRSRSPIANGETITSRTLLGLLLISFSVAGPLSAQWSATNLTGSINTVYSNGGVLLAGMNGGYGVLITTDDGVTWSGSDAGLTQYSDVRAFASNPSYVFTGTTGGVYRSNNAGPYNWTKVIDSVSCFSLLVNGSNVFAGTMGGGVYFSGDNGSSWTQVNTGLTMLYVYALASNSQYIFAGTYHYGTTNGAGVFRSSNNGQTWTHVSNGLTNTTIMSLAVKGSYLFAGTNGGGIFRSGDNGDNWTNVAGGVVHTLKVVCDTDLYAGLLSSGGVLRTTDDGANWTTFNTGLPVSGGSTVMSLTYSNTYLFAGTLGGGVARAPYECIPPIQNEACITWDLLSDESVTSVSGAVQGQPEIIGAGSSLPAMTVYGYSNGQQLWVGNTGGTWVPNNINNPTLDAGRFIEFNATPLPGNSFTVSNVSFNYGDLPLGTDFKILNFQAFYSTDQWLTSTVLNSSGLDYLNTAMQLFTRSINVLVPSGKTFSMRIYPYPILHGITITPSFATHNTVTICGTTTPEVVRSGSVCGTKFNDVNGDGVQDAGEPGLPNWLISLNVATIPAATTDKDGNYCFNDVEAGTYTVSETPQPGWQQTFPSSPGTHSVTVTAGDTIRGINFGNKIVSDEACISWDLLNSGAVTSVSGNVQGQSEILGTGSSSPLMAVFGYNSGQQLWVGTTGWIAGPLDPMRFIEFNASAAPGYSYTVNNVSFNYGDFPLTTDFSIVNFKASYSTDQWVTSTVLNSTALVYLNTTMSLFTTSVNVPVPNGQTFSLRIYPYALLNGIASTPTFAIHNTVLICGTTVLSTSVDDGNTVTTMPDRFQLEQNFPNPFNPTTTIRYGIARSGSVRIGVYDVLGREIALLVNEEKDPGNYEILFDAENLTSGMYFVIIRSGEFIQSRKMILMK